MAVAFRSLSATAFGVTTNRTGTLPTGAAPDDILRADLYIESDGAIGIPIGWAAQFNGSIMFGECNDASGPFRHYTYWTRLGGASPSFTWTFASAFNGLIITAYSGARSGGDPWSFITKAERDNNASTTFPDVSDTTQVDNELLTWVGVTSDPASAGIPPTGFTERQDAGANEVEVADLIQATAGATGNITGASYTGTNRTATTIMAGLMPERTEPGSGLSDDRFRFCPSVFSSGTSTLGTKRAAWPDNAGILNPGLDAYEDNRSRMF